MKGRSPLPKRDIYSNKPSSFDRKNRSERSDNKIDSNTYLIPKAEPLKAFDIPQLTDFISQFHKQIQSPIDFHTSIHLTKTAQRCLSHNNVSTLYCLNDKLPLCVTCMYQNNFHKKHKVVPLNRAGVELSEELKMCIKGVKRGLFLVSDLVKRSHQNLERAEREFPEVIDKVNRFYQGLHELLVEKKNEQVKHIQQTWSRVNYEYAAYAKQFQRINVYAIEKVNEIEEQTSEEYLLFNRNVSIHLAKLQKIVKDEMGMYHETKYSEELSRFIEVEKIINSKMIFTNPLVETIKRQANNGKKQKNNEVSYIEARTAQITEEGKRLKTDGKEIRENRKRSVISKDSAKSSKAVTSMNTSFVNPKELKQKASPLRPNSRSPFKVKPQAVITKGQQKSSEKRP